mmetsp:Transcript_22800/g.43594  ORF Transcript_22800/g.43594 Transcript_22800/m.43594 type:complete len:316 (-) Transcript_22800:289-1236(-)|eukprot:CAMPEP_0114229930 /NCGR_PEP_ID=MMETSP0058-20121206/3188_1 /TAXON_ID=36894 /ORGANISM="Pyramimonas parkeae, CCMP726" /LENGTH=315 /DNA_ID=CAMNT_0001341075 /DNA_START=679 /DNA_END=1626 /DNA_ORIENTATION=-
MYSDRAALPDATVNDTHGMPPDCTSISLDEIKPGICDLPEPVLLQVLKRLTPKELLQLEASSRSLHRDVSHAVLAWQMHADRLFEWETPLESARARVLAEMSTLCFECQQRTAYVFAPMPHRRLCSECERTHPARYRLVTRTQAAEELDCALSTTQLRDARGVSLRGVQFYLQMDVLELAQKYLKPKHEPTQQDSSDDEEDAAPKKCTSGAGGGMGLGTPKQCEADLKEQRKSNKKTAKLLQRAKRQGLQIPQGIGPATLEQQGKRAPKGVHMKNRTRKSVAAASQVKLSAWEAEREALCSEFGSLFAISGLALA